MNKLLSICIVSYNTADLTLKTIKSVELDINQSTLLNNKTELIVVDNNSSDDSVELLKKIQRSSKLPITIIENNKNLGFAVANNQAIRKSAGSCVLLLNSDTYVQLGSLEKMVSTLTQTPDTSTATLSSRKDTIDHLGVLAATLINPDGTLQPQGGSTPTLFTLATHMFFWDDIPLVGRWLPSTQHTGLEVHWPSPATELKKMDWVAGTAMMIKKEVFDEVGDLDEKIFMYGEDVEFCLRATNHHWDVAINNQAYVTHLQTASSTKLNSIIGEMKGYHYIWSKHRPPWQLGFAKAIIKLGIVLRILVFGTIGKSKKSKMYQQALAEL